MRETYSVPDGVIWGGAIIWAATGRDGCLYVVYTGARGDYFGPLAYRRFPDGRTEWLEINPERLTDIGCSVTVQSDSAWVCFIETRERPERKFWRVKLPGYVPIGFDGKLPEPISPQPLPQPTECRDEEGRRYTTAVKKELIAALGKLEERLRVVEAKGGGVSHQTVRDICWSLAPDAVYADVLRADSGIKSVIVKAVLESPELKEAIRAVLKEK